MKWERPGVSLRYSRIRQTHAYITYKISTQHNEIKGVHFQTSLHTYVHTSFTFYMPCLHQILTRNHLKGFETFPLMTQSCQVFSDGWS